MVAFGGDALEELLFEHEVVPFGDDGVSPFVLLDHEGLDQGFINFDIGFVILIHGK